MLIITHDRSAFRDMSFRAFIQTLVLWFGLMIAASDAAFSAKIEVVRLPEPHNSLVMIKGPIKAGDVARFERETEGLKRAAVLLMSDGGNLVQALDIGARISVRKFSTIVPPDKECYSACALIWMAGARRYMHPSTSRIGFHAAYYRDQEKRLRESGSSNALVGAYLTQLGLRVEAISFMTKAPPDKLMMLSPEAARKLGIDVFLIDDKGEIVSSPQESPTVDAYVRNFVAYSTLMETCGADLGLDEQFLSFLIKGSFDRGHEIVSAEQWNRLLGIEIDALGSELRGLSRYERCFYLERDLRTRGHPSGVDGPSFQCERVKAADEKAICKHAGLWPLDRIMTRSFERFHDMQETEAAKKKLMSEQSRWLKKRRSCGGDPQCLKTLHEQRISELTEAQQ